MRFIAPQKKQKKHQQLGLCPAPIGGAYNTTQAPFSDPGPIPQRLHRLDHPAFGAKSGRVHKRRLDGGDHPHGQKVVGAMPPSRHHGNFMLIFINI